MEPNQSIRERAIQIMALLAAATEKMAPPASLSIVAEYGQDPYLVLISCLLSLRTKDTTSLPASRRLFSCAPTVHEMVKLPPEQIAKIIYPVGFYRVKAATILSVSHDIINRFEGRVPADENDLLSLKGVGRKTMNLVRAEGFGLPAICVDVHVHRIANRLGIIATKTPEETERALKLLLPPESWNLYNRALVVWGQNICVPVSPRCSRCDVYALCDRVGVKKSR